MNRRAFLLSAATLPEKRVTWPAYPDGELLVTEFSIEKMRRLIRGADKEMRNPALQVGDAPLPR